MIKPIAVFFVSLGIQLAASFPSSNGLGLVNRAKDTKCPTTCNILCPSLTHTCEVQPLAAADQGAKCAEYRCISNNQNDLPFDNNNNNGLLGNFADATNQNSDSETETTTTTTTQNKCDHSAIERSYSQGVCQSCKSRELNSYCQVTHDENDCIKARCVPFPPKSSSATVLGNLAGAVSGENSEDNGGKACVVPKKCPAPCPGLWECTVHAKEKKYQGDHCWYATCKDPLTAPSWFN
ncbi:hypothetical protein BDR26DRAFT_861207 [Obelidium mucronatum]|nr:hypothetical protein BDR26DRAFT_861207 [Obelidium mucronatum]